MRGSAAARERPDAEGPAWGGGSWGSGGRAPWGRGVARGHQPAPAPAQSLWSLGSARSPGRLRLGPPPDSARSRSASRELPHAAALGLPQPAALGLHAEASSQSKGEVGRTAPPPPHAPRGAPAADQAAGQAAGQVVGQVAGQVAGASQPTAVEAARLESLAWLQSLGRGARLDGAEQGEQQGDRRATGGRATGGDGGGGAGSSCAGGGGGGSSGGGSEGVTEGGAGMGGGRTGGGRPPPSGSRARPGSSPLGSGPPGGTPLCESAPDWRPAARGDASSLPPSSPPSFPSDGGRRGDQPAEQLEAEPAARAKREAGGGSGVVQAGGGSGVVALAGSSGCRGDAELPSGPPPRAALEARLRAAEAEAEVGAEAEAEVGAEAEVLRPAEPHPDRDPTPTPNPQTWP